ncbi:transcriptional regulator [Stenotrophomonas sp. ZAC14D2_NAIMI4_7]|uniref:helix-turn-helix domain-containing protein n=1 Tax=Stenotrophomonas sp. ZAC14D2_NAIMI4_7 TaxID=2072405 RepID=UPI000D53FC65|nr:helix-turn-helix domain-containing protein [Stenotrophomonas sp. ZAC14D2_NAIMI4_7]AWH15985.1 transcriptional regulator [Stenotrophomonas sp. ZAC14D2_NAIMI4_7]
MKIRLDNAAALGPLVKAVRKYQGLRQDATAEGIGVSENFLAKIERGGTTVQWDKLFTVLKELGLHVEIDVPDAAMTPAGTRRKGNPR